MPSPKDQTGDSALQLQQGFELAKMDFHMAGAMSALPPKADIGTQS
jgi:hypothetical protein